MKLKNFAWAAAALVLAACDSPLDTTPRTSVPSETALQTAENVRAAMIGAYDGLQLDNLYTRELRVYPDLYADNLNWTGTFTSDQQVWLRDISPSNAGTTGIWDDSYEAISRVNSILAALPSVSDLPAGEATQYEGEARFLRALSYFNLVRLFGGVPLVLEPVTAPGAANQVARSTEAQTYAQIESDLTAAASLMAATTRPERASRAAANALLAKVYLTEGKYAEAAARLALVTNYTLTPRFADLYEVQNTRESIFELQYTVNDPNSLAFWFFPRGLGGRRGFAPTTSLRQQYAAGDARQPQTIGVSGTTVYGNRYFRIANGDDNVIVLRYADVVLMRAEVNARLGASADTVLADVNRVRARAGIAPLTITDVNNVTLPAGIANTTQERLLQVVLNERRREFALEGERFFDLKRFGRAQVVLGIDATQLLWPIPQSEIDVNPNLVQNPGY